jgi:hypothetical protein
LTKLALALLLSLATVLLASVHAQQRPETKKMSQSAAQTPLEKDVGAALADYDKTRSADALQHAADQVVREDGVAPDDPAASAAEAHVRLRLWMSVLGRFKRDVDPKFDPTHPPPLTVAPPKVGNTQFPPGIRPSDIKDAEVRKKYEAAIDENERRVDGYKQQSKLREMHARVVQSALGSLRDVRDTLGMPAPDIIAALQKADILAADKRTLSEGIAG